MKRREEKKFKNKMKRIKLGKLSDNKVNCLPFSNGFFVPSLFGAEFCFNADVFLCRVFFVTNDFGAEFCFCTDFVCVEFCFCAVFCRILFVPSFFVLRFFCARFLASNVLFVPKKISAKIFFVPSFLCAEFLLCRVFCANFFGGIWLCRVVLCRG